MRALLFITLLCPPLVLVAALAYMIGTASINRACLVNDPEWRERHRKP